MQVLHTDLIWGGGLRLGEMCKREEKWDAKGQKIVGWGYEGGGSGT